MLRCDYFSLHSLINKHEEINHVQVNEENKLLLQINNFTGTGENITSRGSFIPLISGKIKY